MGQGMQRSPWAAMQQPGQPGLSVADFATLLLLAATRMAGRSARRQADLEASLRCAGLPTRSPLIPAALRRLQRQGCVTDLVALADGGLLMTVTRQDSEQSRRMLLPLPDHEREMSG
jgi:hypothetical protein